VPPQFCRVWVLALASLAGLSAPGCTTTTRLVAADGSHRLIGRDASSGITVVLTTESWPGDVAWGEDLTIIHLLVANMGSEPLLIAPGDFELRDRRGFRYTLYDAGGAFQAVTSDLEGYEQAPIYDPGRSRRYEPIETYDGELSHVALPWGVLLPGTQMRGFVYFDDVRSSANHATLVWRAQTPDHRPLADFGFELHVSRQPSR
jgi:hypothetical protein